jgi:hypothetical protein
MPVPATTDSPISQLSEAPKHSKPKRILLVVGLIAVAAATGYAAGRLQTADLIRQAESRYQELDRKRQTAQEELRSEQQKVQRLDARRHLHLAILAVEERNFGIAQNELELSNKLLSQSGPAQNDALAKVAAQMQGQKLIATEDLSVQRQKLLAWVRALDAALP